jgi:hypothetical protein
LELSDLQLTYHAFVNALVSNSLLHVVRGDALNNVMQATIRVRFASQLIAMRGLARHSYLQPDAAKVLRRPGVVCAPSF